MSDSLNTSKRSPFTFSGSDSSQDTYSTRPTDQSNYVDHTPLDPRIKHNAAPPGTVRPQWLHENLGSSQQSLHELGGWAFASSQNQAPASSSSNGFRTPEPVAAYQTVRGRQSAHINASPWFPNQRMPSQEGTGRAAAKGKSVRTEGVLQIA